MSVIITNSKTGKNNSRKMARTLKVVQVLFSILKEFELVYFTAPELSFEEKNLILKELERLSRIISGTD